MIQELLDFDIAPIHFDESIESCIELFDSSPYEYLPVVNEFNVLIGVLKEDDILSSDADTVEQMNLMQHLIYDENIQFIEAIKYMNISQTDILFIKNSENVWLGSITNHSLMRYMRTQWLNLEFGTLLVLETDLIHYQLKDIVRILESEGINILSLWTKIHPELNKIQINLHLDKNDLKNSIGIFENYKYEVLFTMNEVGYQNFIQERYDSLIHYLNI